MVWAKLDDCILDNPKIARAGVIGFALHVAAITWCCRNLTDGFIPVGRVACLLDMSQYGMSQHDRGEDPALPAVDAMDVADWLVECELWHFESGGYWLNDFLDYNPSKSKVLAERERGRVRAKSSHESRPKTSGAFAGSSPEDTPDLRRIFGESSHGPVPVPVPVPRETETPPTVGGPASPPTEPGEVTKTRRRKKPKTFCPESRASAGEIRDWSDKWAIPIGHGEFTGFLDYHRKHDSGFCDWSAAWRTWLKNAPKFATRGLAQKPAEITKQPADLTAPWLQDDYVGKNTGT